MDNLNKRGWIKIAEAFVAVILLTGIVLFVISRQDSQPLDTLSANHEIEVIILRSVELNNTLRAEILATSGQVNWTNFNATLPNTRTQIVNKTPSFLNCSAMVCDPNAPCSLQGVQDRNLFVKSVLITSTSSTFKPRMLKLFCFEK